VLSGLPGHAIAHFACHASADLASPSDSGLLVHDHQERALIVSQVIALDLPGAELAFLSACETARVGPVLSDEAIHLGSAFQIAGYRHVVATLWPVGDRPAASMPEKIYQAIQQADSTSIVPVTLHNEVRRIRDIWPGKPSIWAVYAHSGA
jgi:CHAT domain-containing protein